MKKEKDGKKATVSNANEYERQEQVCLLPEFDGSKRVSNGLDCDFSCGCQLSIAE